MSRESLFAAFFFGVFLFLLFQLYLILAPFSAPLILAAVLVITFSPLTARVRKLVRGSRTAAGAVMTLGVTTIVIVPAVLLLSLLVEDAAGARATVENLLAEESPRELLESQFGGAWRSLTERFPALASFDISSAGLEASKRMAAWIAGETRVLARSIVMTAFSAAMMLLALFFFFRDGDRIASLVRDLIPMEDVHKDRILQRLYDTVAAVVQSSMLIAALQGVLSGIGYALIGGLSVSVLLGFLTGVASMIPIVGATLVWLPTALFLVVSGDLLRGLGLIAWGLLAVGSIDNFVRPIVIGGRVEMPTFLLLFALIGGLQVYGFLGIFLAPIVVAVLLAFVDIYRETYVDAVRPTAR